MTAVFGFDGQPTTELTCAEYDALWAAFNIAPRHGPLSGRLVTFSTYTDPDVACGTAWGFPGQDRPALAEWVPAGGGCRHWLFAQPRDDDGQREGGNGG